MPEKSFKLEFHLMFVVCAAETIISCHLPSMQYGKGANSQEFKARPSGLIQAEHMPEAVSGLPGNAKRGSLREMSLVGNGSEQAVREEGYGIVLGIILRHF